MTRKYKFAFSSSVGMQLISFPLEPLILLPRKSMPDTRVTKFSPVSNGSPSTPLSIFNPVSKSTKTFNFLMLLLPLVPRDCHDSVLFPFEGDGKLESFLDE
ncbi:hypothetical protein BpHYR1_012654 [Brachionus plicatilis]|uniref:Uncharacterized protein n=1 Tax=Brachionus plicatilis TaxID=10195 RepID=A0A3M7SVA0_BRAPC|nr:hypothetical protein BpHYR1_012654 [Brachionus plicatilis]